MISQTVICRLCLTKMRFIRKLTVFHDLRIITDCTSLPMTGPIQTLGSGCTRVTSAAQHELFPLSQKYSTQYTTFRRQTASFLRWNY